MKIVEYIARVFAFRNTPTTVLLLAVYVAIFASVLVTDQLPRVPKARRGAVDEAYADLQAVSSLTLRRVTTLSLPLQQCPMGA